MRVVAIALVSTWLIFMDLDRHIHGGHGAISVAPRDGSVRYRGNICPDKYRDRYKELRFEFGSSLVRGEYGDGRGCASLGAKRKSYTTWVSIHAICLSAL